MHRSRDPVAVGEQLAAEGRSRSLEPLRIHFVYRHSLQEY